MTAPLLLVFVLQATPPAPSLRAPAIVFTAAQAADVGTTCYALSTGRFYERNRLLGSSCGRVAATKALTSGAILWTHRKLAKRHPKAARISLWVAAGISIVPVALNLRQLHRR